MFELDTTRTFIETTAEGVLDIYTAINRSNVAVPDGAPEPAQAYIASVYSEGVYFVYIYLYLSNTNSGLLYPWSEGGVSGEEINGIYQSAFEFTESMGFMMDDMRYRDKSPEEKAQTFAEVPSFHSDLSFMKTDGAEEAEEDKAGEGDEELVIEPIAEEAEAEESVAEEAEDINLGVLGDEDDVSPEEVAPDIPESEEVTEISLGGDADEDIVLGAKPGAAPPEIPDEGPVEVSIEKGPAPGDGAVAEAVSDDADDESFLDNLEMNEESEPAAAEEIMVEEVTLAPGPDEQTIEAAPVPGTIEEPAAGPESEPEASLTPEEASVLGGLKQEPAPEPPPQEQVEIEEAEPDASEAVAEAVEAEEEEAASTNIEKEITDPETSPEKGTAAPDKAEEPAGTLGESKTSDKDYEILVRFLAMM